MHNWKVLGQPADEDLDRSEQNRRSLRRTANREEEYGGKKDEVIGNCQAMPRPWKRDVDSIR